MKNEDINRTGNVSGLLLYAKTDETKDINHSFNMDGNRIGVRSLDLGQEFSGIKGQLNGIVGEYFGLECH